MSNIDFLAVGDITTDAFIRLKDAHVNCRIDTEACELCMRFADKIPYEFVEVVPAVGNSPNAAVAAARLGLTTALASNMGGDANGDECIRTFQKEKVLTDFIARHKGAKTNYHYVLWFEADRTILVKHEHYPYHFPEISPAPRWLYLSSIGNGTEKYHDEIADFLEENTATKLAFQPGTFQIELGTKRLERLYKKTHVFCSNREEAERILKIPEGADIKKLLTSVASLGPKIVLITDGPKGAYLLDDGKQFFMPPYPDPKPAFERTGAGDAFASTFASALALGKTAREALRWAPINSMSVVQQIGAQKGLLSRMELEKILAEAPSEFKAVDV